MFRNTWIGLLCMALLAWGATTKPRSKPIPRKKPVAVKPQAPRLPAILPYPSTEVLRWGYENGPATPLCCQARLIGWTSTGAVAVLSSSHSPFTERVRYAIELLDPVSPDPEEIFSEEFFLGDDTLPEGCQGHSDPLRCVWTLRRKPIGEALRMNGLVATDIRMRPLAPFSVKTIPDPLGDAQGLGVGLSVSENNGRMVLEVPDTLDRGIHLWPLGTVARNRPSPQRFFVLRLFQRDSIGAAPTELGVRLVKIDGL